MAEDEKKPAEPAKKPAEDNRSVTERLRDAMVAVVGEGKVTSAEEAFKTVKDTMVDSTGKAIDFTKEQWNEAMASDAVKNATSAAGAAGEKIKGFFTDASKLFEEGNVVDKNKFGLLGMLGGLLLGMMSGDPMMMLLGLIVGALVGGLLGDGAGGLLGGLFGGKAEEKKDGAEKAKEAGGPSPEQVKAQAQAKDIATLGSVVGKDEKKTEWSAAKIGNDEVYVLQGSTQTARIMAQTAADDLNKRYGLDSSNGFNVFAQKDAAGKETYVVGVTEEALNKKGGAAQINKKVEEKMAAEIAAKNNVIAADNKKAIDSGLQELGVMPIPYRPTEQSREMQDAVKAFNEATDKLKAGDKKGAQASIDKLVVDFAKTDGGISDEERKAIAQLNKAYSKVDDEVLPPISTPSSAKPTEQQSR